MSEQSGSDELEVRETFKVASEFAPHVTVTEETFFGHGWQPLTTSVLMSLWFLPADASFDIPFLVDWYQRLGWKGANGKPLGAPVIRREISLIREAGYVTVTRLRGESGQAVGIQYSVSQRRSDQPENGAWIPALPGTEEIRRSSHMQPMTTRGQSPHVGNGENRRSAHVQPMTTRGQSPHVGDEANPQVAPRVANGVHPPHPPEEVETSSPYPLKASTPGREEGASFASNNEDQIQSAYEFLQDLPNPWRAGRATARKLAPKLAEAASEQGWSLDADLVKKLTEMPEGIKSYPSVLARRVDDLPRRGPSRVPGAQRDRYSDVPERPDQVVPSEEGMATVRAALAAFRGEPGAR